MTPVNPRSPLRILGVSLLLVCAAWAAQARDPAPEYARLEREVARRVNAHRVARHMAALAYDTALATIARAHSSDMAARRVPMGHDGFEHRAERIGRRIPFQAIAENVAFNDYGAVSTVRVAVEGWLSSPHHLANIEGKYEVTGVGIVRGRDGTFYFTQLFVARRPANNRRR